MRSLTVIALFLLVAFCASNAEPADTKMSRYNMNLLKMTPREQYRFMHEAEFPIPGRSTQDLLDKTTL
jgi:hypothetical protein